jgi:hypothetical protein
MKMNTPTFSIASSLLAACLWGLGLTPLTGAELKGHPSTGTSTPPTDEQAGGHAAPAHRNAEELHLKVVHSEPGSEAGQKQVPWLGLATEEASEALTAQLRLDPGAGLTVTYVSPDGPAAKAALQKNDVLVELDGQMLVHPAQLRKLIQVRKEGDTAKLTYYRAGKKESASVTLAKTTEPTAWLEGEQGWKGLFQKSQGFQEQFRDRYGDPFREQMKNLQRSLGNLRIEKEQVQQDVRRSMEEARKAAQDALRHATNGFRKLDPTAKMLDDIARGRVEVSKDATVTVNSSSSSVQTMVKADDTGTYVIVANPRKHLTAHDPDGKLLFDAEIETSEQQAKVPKEIWQKVEPMVTKIGAAKETAPASHSDR